MHDRSESRIGAMTVSTASDDLAPQPSHIMHTADVLAGSAPQNDDMTAIVLRVPVMS
jgi:hypothetical protein